MNYGIGNVKGGGGVSNTMLITTTDATENSGTYTLDLTYLSETPKVNDYVVYVDNGVLTTLYQVSAVGSTEATLIKIGDLNGDTLYQHNIYFYRKASSSDYQFVSVEFINNNPNPMTYSDIVDSLTSLKPNTKECCGSLNGYSTWAITVASGTSNIICYYNLSSVPTSVQITNDAYLNLTDKVKELSIASINSGPHLYQHRVRIKDSTPTFEFFITIVSTKDTAYNLDSLKAYFSAHQNKLVEANGLVTLNGSEKNVLAIGYNSSQGFYAKYSLGAVFIYFSSLTDGNIIDEIYDTI